MPVWDSSGESRLNAIELKLSDAVTLAVPESLQSITAYVLLEQERWFEKEMDFLRHWLRPGMTVIDIGANLGVYSVPMARLVGQTGHVFAYEPGSEARRLLERNRELNAAVNLDISPLALSDRERDGRLVFGGSSELYALGDSGDGEMVHITSLDREDATRSWPSPDFVKIDSLLSLSALGRVSRVSPVQTAVRNCTRDEGRSFEAGSQVQVSNRCKLLSPKAMVVSVAVNVGTISRRVRLREASASEPSMKCRKRIRRCQNRGVTLPPGSARGMP